MMLTVIPVLLYTMLMGLVLSVVLIAMRVRRTHRPNWPGDWTSAEDRVVGWIVGPMKWWLDL